MKTKEYYYKYYKDIIENKGGSIISTEYIDAKTHLEYKCNNGHNISTQPRHLKNGGWCGKCYKNRLSDESRSTKIYNEAKKIIQDRGGQIISAKYIDSATYIEFQCKYGHNVTKKNITELRAGKWCKFCNKTDSDNKYYNRYKKIIEKNGGTIISTEYIDSSVPIEYICDKGHTISSLTNSLKSGSWCNICNKDRLSRKDGRPDMYNEAKKIIEDKGGSIISSEYINAHTPLKFKCENGHIYSKTRNELKRGEWCFECNKISIEICQKIALKRGGLCLSDTYINHKTNLSWECADGHQWKATINNVKNRKTWCPKCRVFIKEEICRTLFETMFNKKFIKSKPDWLMGSKGYLLELDGYCEELNLAFEYNGMQHYKVVYNEESLKRAQRNDKLKNKTCTDKKIHLINIPYTVKTDDMQQYIIDYCQKLNITIPNKKIIDVDTIEIPYKKNLDNFRSIAEQNGGSLLSKSYLGSTRKYEFKCKNGHIFKLTPQQFKNNKWCPTCTQ